jgi:hypothetical protein
MGFKKEYIIFFIPTLLIKKRIHDEYKYLLLIKIRIENLRAFLSIPFFFISIPEVALQVGRSQEHFGLSHFFNCRWRG